MNTIVCITLVQQVQRDQALMLHLYFFIHIIENCHTYFLDKVKTKMHR